jgi:hypothetical protein
MIQAFSLIFNFYNIAFPCGDMSNFQYSVFFTEYSVLTDYSKFYFFQNK